MNRYRVVAALLVAVLESTGCLVKETTHRVYLSPSGTVAWMVLEESVRSDEDDLAKRRQEEQAWLDACIGDTNPVGEGLRRLGAERVSTRLLRTERPYIVLTDAHFARVDSSDRRAVRGAGSSWKGHAAG